MSRLREVTIHTDGACVGNPGPGGYGAILEFESHRKEISGGFRKTTNNRMEIMGAIIALESLKERCRVTVYSDSAYVVKAISKGWAKRWKANGWMRDAKKGEKALNPDLWERLLNLCEKHEVEFKWVKGHNSNRDNERCDKLANEAAAQSNLLADTWYEGQIRNPNF